VAETKAAARQLGIVLLARTVANADELPGAFAQFRREQAQALIVQVSPLALDQRARIAELAVRQRLPAMYEIRNFVEAGGLVSYGPDLQDMYRRAATYVDRIFRGAKAGDLAIEQPGKFEMVINMQTANALGVNLSAVGSAARRRGDSVAERHELIAVEMSGFCSSNGWSGSNCDVGCSNRSAFRGLSR
jgi:putative ABC transport system substrate-binding protein